MGAMNIPPFPAHDLAKLVLGYLAEEQLMTAYDEFLSASPYLDAMRNEYDRIFMTSLKNILAEYRAVKIYVESCKPYSLRRRLFGCTNLLEIVKFLVQNVDHNKLQVPEVVKPSVEGRNTCAVCLSLKLPSCECKGHSVSSNSQSTSQRSRLETSVEATPLEDLPGNHVTNRKKQVKTLSKDSRASQSALSGGSNLEGNVGSNFTPTFDNTLPNNSHTLQARICNSALNSGDLSKSNVQNMGHINHATHQGPNMNYTENVTTQRVSLPETFQDFTSGVEGAENINSNVPDSSTSENVSLHSSSSKEICLPGPTNNMKPVSKAHIFLTVGTIKTSTTPQPISTFPAHSPALSNRHKPKTNEKVTILSDIKVDKTFNTDSAMPVILKNATSTPLMHMQTILINGTPVYQPHPSASVHNRNFTKDEIMAMPTIIVVPTSGASQVPPNEQVVVPQSTNPPTTISSTAQSLQPLTLDVASNNPPVPHDNTVSNNSMPLLDQQKDNEKEMLVKTLDTKMVSAPRDGGEPTNKNTPQVLPPVRKSSSTPRRTSHVRVLDFATPRRILQEAINENVAEEGTPVEVVISRSPNLHTLTDTTISEHTVANADKDTHKAADSTADSSGSSKENDRLESTLPPKKNNWDADLRAHAITNKKEDIPKSCIQPRCRPRSKTNKSKLSLANKKSKEKSADENVNKCKNAKSKRKSVEVVEESVIVVDDTLNVPVKPTINIIAGQDWSVQDTDKNQNNKSNSTDPTDTPEMERLLTNNGIGIKLNISDLLETPYKQVLYDIQMETPRFLGPDIPGEPLSDIKICNIPTPRFLNTPKVQATPSSYSSRPTDYSSGGSYYKPDDQDYIPVDLEYPVTKSTECEIPETKNDDEPLSEKVSKSNSRAKSGRPVRKCAKNVSYYNSPNINRTKEMDDKIDNISPSKDRVSMSNSSETKVHKSIGSKHVKDSKTEKTSGSKSGKERKVEKESGSKSVRDSKVEKESGSKSVRDNKVEKESGSKSVKESNVEKELESKLAKDYEIEKGSESTSVVDSIVPKESINESAEGDKLEKELEAKPVKGKTKRTSKSKKYKSPLKRQPPKINFMKIKPRRVTPVKERVKGKGRPRKSEEQSRKRTMSKENTIEAAPVIVRAPTKSRRKSATPRKSDRYVANFNSSEDSETRVVAVAVQDSDTEQVQLHWSDEGSQDTKRNEPQKNASTNETEDISKIKDYIASELQNAKFKECSSSSLNNLHVDLIKRGFDVETAKIIERDLLDSPADPKETNTNISPPVTSNKDEGQLEKTLESDTSNNLRIQEDEEEEDCEEFEFTESECHENSANYITCNHDDSKDIPRALAIKLKDKFSMEICIDDGVTVRLRATPITTLIDQDPHDFTEYNEKETESAINSISNIDKLYTPMKDPDIREQVYNIFDSTLTSLDTPIKVSSPKRKVCDSTAPHVTLEVESVEDKEIPEDKRRKRLHSDESNDSVSSNKRSKTEAQYFSLHSANIQNIDIETVLSKLHGP